MTSPDDCFFYQAFGWKITSEIELPLLRESTDSIANPDIRISIGPVEPADISRRQYRQRFIQDQMRFIVDAGRHIIVEPLVNSQPSNVSSLTVSRLLTIAAYHRGQLPLHASAVRFGNNLVVICGPSGGGKSTLAAMLFENGGQFHEDDMIVVKGTAPFHVEGPSTSGIKLSKASLLKIGRSPHGLTLANQVENKYFMPLASPELANPKIAAIIQMGSGDNGLRTVSAVEAVAGWRACIRQHELMTEAPNPSDIWQNWLDLVASTDNFVASHGGSMNVSAELASKIAKKYSS